VGVTERAYEVSSPVNGVASVECSDMVGTFAKWIEELSSLLEQRLVLNQARCWLGTACFSRGWLSDGIPGDV
jgi:hypothetical protein